MSISCKVLIVDDEADIVEEIVDALDCEGFRCHGVASADEALALLGADPEIDLIVTDLKMPGKSGEDLIIEARKIPGGRHLFIVASGHGDTTTSSTLRELEVFAVLNKPIDVEDLIETVRRGARQLASAEIGTASLERR